MIHAFMAGAYDRKEHCFFFSFVNDKNRIMGYTNTSHLKENIIIFDWLLVFCVWPLGYFESDRMDDNGRITRMKTVE